MKKLVILSSVIALSSCASMIMEKYVGRTIADAIMDRGMPAGAFDIDTKTRAFTWQKSSTISFGGSATTSGVVIGNQMFATTYVSPPQSASFTCQYTVFAERFRTDIEGPGAWRITGFRKPSLLCE